LGFIIMRLQGGDARLTESKAGFLIVLRKIG
jgi:hypothetical protein